VPIHSAPNLVAETKVRNTVVLEEIPQLIDQQSQECPSDIFRRIKRDLKAHLTVPSLSVMDEKAQSLTYLRNVCFGVQEKVQS
jgi:hypothetical protein